MASYSIKASTSDIRTAMEWIGNMPNLATSPDTTINIMDFNGADPTGTTESTAAIGYARAAARAAGGGIIVYPPGTFLSSNQDISKDVGIYHIGSGIGATTIKLKNGANTDLFSAQTNLINLSAAANSGPVGTLHNFGFANMTLDGNKANQSGGTSYLFRFYGYDFLITDVEIHDGYTGGWISDWNGGFGIASPSDQMESRLTRVKIHDCNGIGLQYSGPHDSHFDSVFSFSNGSHNFHFAPNSNGVLLVNCHGYGLANVTGVCSFLVETGTGFNAVNCIIEGASQYGMVVLGNLAVVSGQIPNGNIGLQIGQTAGQTPFPGQINQSAGLTTAVTTSGLSTQIGIASCTTGIVFANEANGLIIANIFQTSGQYLSGTPAASDTFLINGKGLTSDGTLAKSGGFQFSSSANPAFYVRGSDGSHLFRIDGTASGGASGIDVPGGFHITPGGGLGVNTLPNSVTAELVNTGSDTVAGIRIFPNSSSQSAPLFATQNPSFSDVFTIDKNGNAAAASIATTQSATAPVLATSGTIATANIGVSRVAPAGAVTGIILAAGTQAGQMVTVVNESVAANTITFATSATSHVAGGTGVVIAGLAKLILVWDSSTSLWY